MTQIIEEHGISVTVQRQNAGTARRIVTQCIGLNLGGRLPHAPNHNPHSCNQASPPCRRSASSPTGTEKRNTPCGFMMFRMGGAQKHSPGSMSPWRTIDRTIRSPCNRPSRQWHPNPSRIPQAHCRQPRSAGSWSKAACDATVPIAGTVSCAV